MAREADLAELGETDAQAAHDCRSHGDQWCIASTADRTILSGALAASGGRRRRGHHVLDAVAGAHAAVVAGRPPAVLDPGLGQGGLPVVPEEVVVQPGRTCAQGRTSSSVRWRCTYQSIDRPRAAMASCHRVTSKHSDHSWKVPPARQTCSITAPMRRSPRLAMPSASVARGSCHLSWTPRAAGRVPQQARPCGAAPRPCSGRTTGTGCGAWARSRRPRR